MNKKTRNIIISLALLLLLFGAWGVWTVYSLFFTQAFDINQSVKIYVDRDDDFDSVCWKIEDAAHPKTMKGFRLLAEKNGYASRIKTGCFEIKPTDNVRYLERRLRLGYQTPVRLTVGSVRTLDRLARNVSEQLMLDSMEIASLLADTAYVRQLGYSLQTLPALFIPNTYEVYWNMDANQFMDRMLKENKIFWTEQRLKKAEAIGLTPVQVATLASIVEEETAVNEEKPMVAGLYINRLKKGMLLQADPTVKFSLKEFGLRRILFKHLEVDSPYNTYKYAGLPPGPIRIPSIAGIESVLNYAHHNYLYMCAKEDFLGTHNFAVTSAQHAANARKYQQALNRRGIR